LRQHRRQFESVLGNLEPGGTPHASSYECERGRSLTAGRSHCVSIIQARRSTRMKARDARLLAVFASFGLAAAAAQDVHAQSKPPVYEKPVGLFRVIIVVHATSSDWHDTYAVNPEYPSFEMCEAARADLVEGFIQFLERRYLEPFNADSKCARSDSHDDV